MGQLVIAFDLDGTLVDTASEIAEAANRTLVECGLPRQPLQRVRRHIGAGTQAMMQGLLAEVLADFPGHQLRLSSEQIRQRLDHHYSATAGTQAVAYAGAQQMLQGLRALGIRLACVTNKEQVYARQVLDACGLSPWLDLLIGGDSLAWRKPDPRVLQHALQVLGGQARHCAHVGDSQTDVDTARAAGVKAWAVPWGYNADRPIATAAPDRIFDSLPDLLKAVQAGALQPPQATLQPV